MNERVSDLVYIPRYGAFTRVNHWITAACFILLTFSGLAMFHPVFFWAASLFGGGQATRTIHPWIGLVLFVSYALLFICFATSNWPNRDDVEWSRRIVDVINNREENLPELGKYNAGQKSVFWSQAALIIVLLVTGLLIRDWYFYGLTTIPQKRIAVLIHSLAAIFAITIIIVHIYSAIWVRGTMRAMTRGTVTIGWAYRHHRRWLRDYLAQTAPAPRRTGSD
ncbi:MAG: formate dehydrogenase subunit gamma [Acetobacteraceae bacterium]|nr:formate dehydrogenase subunit gamma [Acetobacteraceae bacterium]